MKPKRKLVIIDWLWNDGQSPSPGGEAWVHIVDLDALIECNERAKGWGVPFKMSDLKRADLGDVYGSDAWGLLDHGRDLFEDYDVFDEGEANIKHYRKYYREELGEGVEFWVKEWGTRKDSPFSDPNNQWDAATQRWRA